jgi:hypothetical protein
MGVYFNGRYYIKPQVATYVDDNALTPVGLVGANVIGMMGPSKDGVPNQGYLITSLTDATEIFKEGPLVDGISAAFAQGALYIWATRVGGSYAGGTFSNVPSRSSATVTNLFTLRSVGYGAHANNTVVTFTCSSPLVYNRVLDISVAAENNKIETLGMASNVIKFANANANTVTFTIAVDTGVYVLVITDGGGGNTSPDINLGSYSNMFDLKTGIDAAMAAATPAPITSVTVTVVDSLGGTGGIQLDSGAFSATTGAYNYLSNTVKRAFDWLNSSLQPYVIAEQIANAFTTAVNKNLTVLTAAPFTLTGGTYGAVPTINATSYEGVLAEVYEDLDLDLVVPIVDNYLVWAGVDNSLGAAIFQFLYLHCKMMSETKSEERIGLVGFNFGANDDSVTATISNAALYNSPYISLCSPRLKFYSLQGVLKTWNGTYTAAAIAGMIANYPVGEPITNKTLSGITDLSTIFKNADILQLIDNGVLTIERVRGIGYKVVQGVTTWISDDNFNRKELSVRLVTNYVAKNCRENLKQFIGRKNSLFMLETIKGSLISVLKDLEDEGVIVGTTTYPAYRNITLTADGDVVRVSFECSPVLPINYILITIHATIFKATI